MMEFQLDECISDPDFANSCEVLAKRDFSTEVQVHLLPRSLKSKDDDEVLDAVMAGALPLITIDRKLVSDHTSHIPDRHPGIIIVASVPGSNRTMTTRLAAKILTDFKRICPDWQALPLNSLILEVTQAWILVQHSHHGLLVTEALLSFSENDWNANFLRIVREIRGQHT